ncbi:MAG TPA: nuclear transport factor 2 family protein [Solirubrobacteraceae bacterium]|nr:nuclear transport factor 2 family protein [Solirubrobacteraceae bacterium]
MTAREERIEGQIRGAAAALNRGDLDGFAAFIDPDVEFTSLVAEMEGETYRGHEGIRRWWSNVREAFVDGRWIYEEIHVAGDAGFARVRIEGKLGGVPVEQSMWQAFRMRGDLACWWAFYRSEDEAREAVGMAR